MDSFLGPFPFCGGSLFWEIERGHVGQARQRMQSFHGGRPAPRIQKGVDKTDLDKEMFGSCLDLEQGGLVCVLKFSEKKSRVIEFLVHQFLDHLTILDR